MNQKFLNKVQHIGMIYNRKVILNRCLLFYFLLKLHLWIRIRICIPNDAKKKTLIKYIQKKLKKILFCCEIDRIKLILI